MNDDPQISRETELSQETELSRVTECFDAINSLKIDPAEVCLLIIAKSVTQQYITSLSLSKKLQDSNTASISSIIPESEWQQIPERRWAKVVIELYLALLNLLPVDEQRDAIKHVEKFVGAEALVAMLEIIALFPELTGSIFRQFAKTIKNYLIWAGYTKITDNLVLDIQNSLEEFASQEDAILDLKINRALCDTIQLIKKELEGEPITK
jgi:hypothetical protein